MAAVHDGRTTMRIERLEIGGFKSFADRVVLRFGDGITGIVGPNGCGKSNIVDAVRWCMGEMSAKQLRGRAMFDVIFAGCESRGPVGMAEVTLTFKNDGNVPLQYTTYDEIAVTRRLHRDGTSEYLINKVPVRLRDVTDLFLGTGVGTRAYSIIEQGRIGFIVSSRPEDRRTIIEEVAGITKFKVRKRAAERRMEATEQNLLRVTDIITELGRQLGSLTRQAKKAERYKKLKEEQRDLELHAATIELMRLDALEKMQRGEHQKIGHRLEEVANGIAAEETKLETERLRLALEEKRLREEQEKSSESDARLAALERDLEHWRRQHEDASSRAHSAATDLQTVKGRVAQAKTERRDLEAHAVELTAQLEQDRAQVATLETALSRLQGSLADVQGEAESLRGTSLEQVHTAAQHRTLAANLDRQRTDVRARLGKSEGERDDLTRRREAAEARRTQLEGAREQVAGQLALWRDKIAGFREQLERVTAKGNESDARVLALKGEITECRSRLESLIEIARRLEGYSDGVRSLLGASDKAAGGAPEGRASVDGIEGLVTDIIDTAPAYERAIEAVLGEKLQYLIVESQKAGMRAIEYLKACAGGRSGFIPLRPRAQQVAQPPSVALPGVVGPALECVSVEPQYRAIAEYLLGDVVLVEELSGALGLWAQNGRQHTLVTLDGEVLDPGGVLAGGSDDGSGLLAKRREARELEEQAQGLERDLALAASQNAELEQARLQLEVNIQQLEKDLHSADLERLEIEKDQEAMDQELTRLDERLEVLGYEIDQLAGELQTIDRDQSAAVGAAQHAEGKQRELESQIAHHQSLARERRTELEQRSGELTNLKVQLASRGEKLAATRQAIERHRLDEVELRARIEQGIGAINSDTTLVADLKCRSSEGESRASQMADEAQERRRELEAARGTYEAEQARTDEIERALRERRKESDHTNQAAAQVKMDLQRHQMERERLVEQMSERHDVDLLKVAGDYHMRDVPGADHEQRRRELETALKNIGPINLTAIEECAEIETRHDFLVGQRDDLQAGLESLKRAVGRINRASRERFKEAFESVNDMFQKVFPRLFRGGEARLELTDAEDLLETGVEIVAQPPGKKLQSVGLLSGGEKALTATALVFAIFLIKPSPFCVLDEVDAPLDDANVTRFNDMLRDIAKISQFIVITHNKLTMAETDRLYGITMEEPGLSKVVSVDLEGQDRAA